jgi:Ca2+-binding RTX toxin-like protein
MKTLLTSMLLAIFGMTFHSQSNAQQFEYDGNGNITVLGTLGDDVITVEFWNDNVRIDVGDRFQRYRNIDNDGPLTITLVGLSGNDTCTVFENANIDDELVSSFEDLNSWLVFDGGEGGDFFQNTSRIRCDVDAGFSQNSGDRCYGGPADDIIRNAYLANGGGGNDRLLDNFYSEGGSGDDTIYTADAPFTITYGGDGDDYIQGGTGTDYIYGQGDDDEIRGGDGNDFLDGGEDSDYVNGQLGADDVRGSWGNDFVSGGNDSSIDTVSGGAGSDSFMKYLSFTSGRFTVRGENGIDFNRNEDRYVYTDPYSFNRFNF